MTIYNCQTSIKHACMFGGIFYGVSCGMFGGVFGGGFCGVFGGAICGEIGGSL